MSSISRRCAAVTLLFLANAVPTAAQRVEIKLGPAAASGATTGRVYVFFARDSAREPRQLGGSYGGSVPFFGADVEGMKPGASATISTSR